MSTILKEYEDGSVDYAKTVKDSAGNFTIDTITVPTDESYKVDAILSAVRSTYADKANFHLRAYYVNDGGVVTLQGRIQYLTKQGIAGISVTLTLASPSVTVDITNSTGNNYHWKCERVANIMESEDDVT